MNCARPADLGSLDLISGNEATAGKVAAAQRKFSTQGCACSQ